MKNIPIVILNRDRLHPVKDLIHSLKSRNYNNIIILDNQTTYEPTLEWYKNCGVEVFHNNIPETLYGNESFWRLAFHLHHPRFVEIVGQHYVFTDSDVVPVETIPENFLDNMVDLCGEFPDLHKLGLGIKIDDLPPDNKQTPQSLVYEGSYRDHPVPHPRYQLYQAPIDTTFAVYTPNSPPIWGDRTLRMDGDYQIRHYPFYYDIDNLPDDEFYYVRHLPPNRGPNASWNIKNYLISKGDIHG
jgi:hypothetical protein